MPRSPLRRSNLASQSMKLTPICSKREKLRAVTPGISAQEYADRRAKLANQLPVNGIAVIVASDVKYRSDAAFYDFHQSSDFFYVTGFNEPDAVAVIENTGHGEDNYIFHLFVRPKDAKAELWEGARSGVQAALDVFNADEARSIKDLHQFLPDMVSTASEVYLDSSPNVDSLGILSKLLGNGSSKSEKLSALLDRALLKPLRPILNGLRAFKSQGEVTNMRSAGQASGRAITTAMKQSHLGEKELAAFLEYQFKLNGCDAPAYVPVVAGGKNALSIHYVRNDDVLRDNQLVLVDAGGEFGGYITDITRSWPINGQFSSAQKDLEDAGVSLDKLHEVAENGLRDQLTQLGFDLSGSVSPHEFGKSRLL
ncbi:MAG: hypothetical protein M1833_003735 [Piccolia ochrophora]|nr:MAG: hypothetical protein M1833_003735 [Piccolia ochrophora]